MAQAAPSKQADMSKGYRMKAALRTTNLGDEVAMNISKFS
jgi:hypothetical protein